LVTNEIKNVSYYHSRIKNNHGNPKALWKTINNLTGRSNSTSNYIAELKINHCTFNDPAEIAELMNI
jgi:hypothetical protein